MNELTALKTNVKMVQPVEVVNLIIPVSVHQTSEERTVNCETIVIVTRAHMERVQTQIAVINVHVLQDIQGQIVVLLIIAINNIAHIMVSVKTIIVITNVDAMAVI